MKKLKEFTDLKYSRESTLSTKLSLLLSMVMLFSCSDNAEIDKEIQIEGGHQIERADGPFGFKYGLFNEYGQPTTEFNQDDKIIFSFWITNNGNREGRLWQFYSEDFFRVDKFEDQDVRIDMGQPHDGMFCQKNGGRPLNSSSTLKFELPWTVPETSIDGGFLWCSGRNAPPLEKGSYRTAFDQSFEFSIDGEDFETEVLSFSIDFSVN